MNKEQIFHNITMFTNQLMNRGMKAEDAAKQAEEVTVKILEASERLSKLAEPQK